MRDTEHRYGTVTRVLHWTMAVLYLSQFLKFGDRINEGEHWIGQTLVPTHVSLGLILLVLVVLRLLWAVRQAARPVHEGSAAMLVKLGHRLLYVVMLLMPITGMLYMLGNGYGLSFFGIPLVGKSETETGWMLTIGSLHSPLAWLFALLVIAHIVIALYHHFIVKDDTLRRMAG